MFKIKGNLKIRQVELEASCPICKLVEANRSRCKLAKCKLNRCRISSHSIIILDEKKKEMLKNLFEDERCQELSGYSILKKMHLGNIIKLTKLKNFDNSLQPHHNECTTLGFTILERSVTEHNLLLTSELYHSIHLKELSTLLEVPVKKTKGLVSQMFAEGQIEGYIDQENWIVYFEQTNERQTHCKLKSEKEELSLEPDSKKKNKRSEIWKIFTLDKDDSDFAICNICNIKVQRCWNKSVFNTTNMINHFKRKHKDLNLETFTKDKDPETSSELTVGSIEETRLFIKNNNTLTPEAVVKMSIDEMASQELDSIVQAETTIIKTHKGVEGNMSKESIKDRWRKRSRSVEEKVGIKKMKESFDEREEMEEDMIRSLEETVSNKSKNFKTSTVTLCEFDEDPDIQFLNEVQPGKRNISEETVWQGLVQMESVAEFSVTAQKVKGKSDLMEKLPNSIIAVGRVRYEDVWKYIAEIKKSDPTDVVVLKLTPADDKDKVSYRAFYNYLTDKNRLAVVNKYSEHINIYVMPFTGEVPPVLQSIIGGAIDKTWPKVLLAIVVRIKNPKTLGTSPSEVNERSDKRNSQRDERRESSMGNSSLNISSEKSGETDWRSERIRVKPTRNMISDVLEKDHPPRLSSSDRKREMIVREDRKLNVIFERSTPPILDKLSTALHHAMGSWVNLKEMFVRENGRHVFTVETMKEKTEILRIKNNVVHRGYFRNDLTERERDLERWLHRKQWELRAIGVKAKAVYMGIFIDGYKWVWDEVRGKLIETDIKFNSLWHSEK